MMRAGFIVSRSCRGGKNFDPLGLTNGRKSLPALLYAQVVQTMRQRRLVAVQHRVVCGMQRASRSWLSAAGTSIELGVAQPRGGNHARQRGRRDSPSML
jgi:hypothetical protein